MTDLGHFVTVDQESQVVYFILDHIVLFLPFEILSQQTRVKKNNMVYKVHYDFDLDSIGERN